MAIAGTKSRSAVELSVVMAAIDALTRARPSTVNT